MNGYWRDFKPKRERGVSHTVIEIAVRNGHVLNRLKPLLTLAFAHAEIRHTNNDPMEQLNTWKERNDV